MPVYNCEIYLENSVESVLDQSFRDFELIIIDDCSTDSSYELALKLKETDNRIIVLKTDKNSGASVARNIGLRSFHGDFLSFVDSDDYVHPEFLKELYNSICENNSDISICGFYKTFKDRLSSFPKLTKTKSFTRTGLECALHIVEDDSILYNVLWNKLYKASLWTDIKFPQGMASEDFHVCYKVLSKATIVSFVPERLYYYYQNKNSVMHTCSNISKFNNTSLDQYNIFLKENICDQEMLNQRLQSSLKYRTDSILEDYYLAFKKKDRVQMHDCSLRFDELYTQMKANNQPLPIKFRIFEANKTLYKLGRFMIELRDTILIILKLDNQGKI